MSRAATFTQADIRRALCGAKAAGETVNSVEIDSTGRIVIRLARTPEHFDNENEWDEVLTNGKTKQSPAERN